MASKQTGTSRESFMYRCVTKELIVKSYLSGSESPSDEGSDLERPLHIEFPKGLSEMPEDYYSVVKASKFLKMGNEDTCVTALALLLGFDLQNQYYLSAVCHDSGLAILVNLSEVNHAKCRLGALKVLRELTRNKNVAEKVVNLGVVPNLVRLLTLKALDTVEMAGWVLANVGHLRRASKALRRLDGIPILVSLLKHGNKELFLAPEDAMSEEEVRLLAATCSAAYALQNFSVFSKNRMAMIKTGIIPVVSQILLTGNEAVSVPLMGLLAECSTMDLFQLAIESEGLVGVLVENLTRDDEGLRMSSASALMRAAGGNPIVRDMIRFHDGLRIIVERIGDVDKGEKALAAAVLGAFWKSAITMDNVCVYQQLDASQLIVPFVNDFDMTVRIQALGCLAEMAKHEKARRSIVSSGIISSVVGMLTQTNPDLLSNVTHLLGELCLDPDGMSQVEEKDGVRLMWSLLKNEHRQVVVKALWAIRNTVTRADDAAEGIRLLTGCLEMLVNMLHHQDVELLTAAAAVVAEVALDYENLSVMTEQGVVRRLCDLADFEGADDALRREICCAIANCCYVRDNLRAFGRLRIIPALSPCLATKDPALLAQACRCFYTLSRDAVNCVAMHGCGVVPHLLLAMESRDAVTQVSAAGCVANIRRRLLGLDYKIANKICSRDRIPSEESIHKKVILELKKEARLSIV